MRTIRIAATAMFVLLLGAVPAQATFHLMRVNEVMLSTGGNANAQFVELIDPSDEPFPSSAGPYKIVVYDANGTRLGAHTISTALLQGRDNTQPLLISTPASDAAFGVTGDEPLDVALPSTGQLCYTAGSSESAFDCVAWGCIATPAASPLTRVPVPPDGQSVQRQGANGSTFQLAQPTPKAQNVPGSIAQPCGSAPSNAFSVKGKKSLKSGAVAITVKVAGPGRVSAKDAGSGKARFKPVKVSASKAGTVTLTVKPTAAARKLIAKRGKLKVKALITFAPTGGKPASHKTSVTFKKPTH